MGYLTGPVNNLADWQVEFNGLLMGPGTPYDIQPGQTFLDMSAIKSMDTQRVWADGSWSGPDFADVLLPTMPVGVGGGSQAGFVAAVQAFLAVMNPAAVPAGLWVKLPGMPAQGIPAKTNKRSLPQDTWNSNYSLGVVQWRSPDPTWQSIPRTINLIASGSATSGLVFPMFAPAQGTYVQPGSADFGSLATFSASGLLTNAGNTPAWPLVVISGPTTIPCTVSIDGNPVTYSQPIPAGQAVTIDYKSGLATLTGNVDRTFALTSRMFSPVTNSSPVFFTADGGSANVTIADITR